MKIVVTGSREWSDGPLLYSVLDEYPSQWLELAQGGALGADWWAKQWCKGRTVCLTYKAHWNTHGKAAGAIRNRRMLDDFRPDLVVAFLWRGAGNRGTMDCLAEAKRRGIPTREVWGGPTT